MKKEKQHSGYRVTVSRLEREVGDTYDRDEKVYEQSFPIVFDVRELIGYLNSVHEHAPLIEKLKRVWQRL